MNILRSAVSGEYQPIGALGEADVVIGQSFGAGPNGTPGEVNERLASFIIDRLDSSLPLILQQEISASVEDQGGTVEYTIEGDPSTATGGQLDSWSVLGQARDVMAEHGYERPILVTQAFLIGRLSIQAAKLGMQPIVPVGLPTGFDPDSTQFWTRSQAAWMVREIPGMAYLKLTGKL